MDTTTLDVEEDCCMDDDTLSFPLFLFLFFRFTNVRYNFRSGSAAIHSIWREKPVQSSMEAREERRVIFVAFRSEDDIDDRRRRLTKSRSAFFSRRGRKFRPIRGERSKIEFQRSFPGRSFSVNNNILMKAAMGFLFSVLASLSSGDVA